jgi:hypothetical protein
LEDFVGNGVLRDQMDALVADGWDDVPTLKMMTTEDMEILQLSQLQRDALEIRTYLHDRNLMEYADTLEASGKTLAELLHTNGTDLSTDYHMKRGHVARFLDRGSACGIQLPKDLTLPARKITAVHHGLETEEPAATHKQPKGANLESVQASIPEQEIAKPKAEPARSDLDMVYPGVKIVTSTDGGSTIIDHSGFKAPVVLRPVGGQPPASKGMFSAPAVQPRLCGLVRPGGIKEEVTPLPVLEKIMVQKLTDAHSKGNNPFKRKGPISIPAPSRASDLWADKPTLILCLRRPGCVMCRAEAHQLYARKPIFDAMGIQLVVCLNEHIDAEVRAFWPRYWGGIMVVDENRDFFKALGQGQLPKEGFITGFVLNSVARANYKRAQETGIEGNLKGEGTIKGGLYIMRPGNGGVAYQFVERNFGDWAPLEEVLDVCGNIQKS